uniref:protocadherin alpha-5-like isoform X9 n=1 Tax=Doryrhamphus excisus TaxID=161450 RepID=UPI0025AE95F4|nr:protocadherin alpha-5-like isoform X9 [Doryrhamphus excisus]
MKPEDNSRFWMYYFLPLFHIWSVVSAQIVYSVTEESNPGIAVGNLAKDLHLDVQDLEFRGLQITGPKARYLEVNTKTGILVVKDRIDREELCSRRLKCSLEVEAITNAPLNLYRFEVKIVDINDNAPYFRQPEIVLNVSESAFPGERFTLLKAFDADVGGYSVKSYKLSQNEHFSLDAQNPGEQSMSAELLLQKALDREKQSVIKLTLTALDGGKPAKSGTLQVVINVQDVNDNIPIFDKVLYKGTVAENAPNGAIILSVNARDFDVGHNGEIEYSIINHDGDNDIDKFDIDSTTGEITVNGDLDHERNNAVEIRVQAKDKGLNPRASHCKVLIEIIDVNDNAPEISVTSLVDVVREDAPIDTMVGLLTVKDNDAGKNGVVDVRIMEAVPFKIKNTYKNHYSLVVNGVLDREQISKYDITITASDEGVPSLFSTNIITVHVSDVNDNAPRFGDSVINIFIKENRPAGEVVYTISADDADVDENAKISFSIMNANHLKEDVARLNININSETGEIVSLQSFDYEKLKTFQFKVQATDSGVPALSSNVTVNVFILDENDNSPTILAPYSEHSSVNSESIPYSAEAGYFVAKIRAVDADSGYNALLSYHLSEPKGNNNLFRMGTSTGEIRTKRRMSDNDLKSHPLVVLVCDHGEASLSATVSIDVVVLESTADIHTPFRHVPIKEETFSDLHLYLLIAIVAVSLIFLLSLITLVAVRCHRQTDGTLGRYGAPMITTHPDGSWSYSKATQQYDVCFSSDTLKSDVVVFPAPFPPVDAELISINGGDTFTRTQTLPNTDKPKAPNSDWRYSASLRAGGVMQSSVHMEESSVMQGAQGVLVQNWPTASSAADAEGGEVSPPMGAGVDSNSWHFRYGPGGPGAPPQHLKPGEVPPEAFIIPGSPAIISIRQNQGGEDDKSDFITFGKKEEAKKKKKKKKDKKDKKDKGKDDDE